MRGVLCGARSPVLRERMVRAAERFNCELLDSLGVPEVIRVVAPEASALPKWPCKQISIFSKMHHLPFSSHLPPCDPPSRARSPSEFPQGADWSIHEFDATKLAWRKIERHETQTIRFGVLRFLIHFQRPRYFLRWKGMTFEMPRAIALYALLKRHRGGVLCYNREVAALSVPAIYSPPRLLERALVLCSGLPPTYDNAQLTYSDVPPEIARFVAELLRQPISIL